MGTNLNQVFILNTGSLQSSADAFTAPVAGNVGVWALDGAGTYMNTALWTGAVWAKRDIQIVQGTAGNPLASPIINTGNIRRIQFDPFVATAGHKVVVTPNATFTGAAVSTVTLKVIVRSTPTDQLSYYDQEGTNYSILSGTDPFPLGAFNTTNHKAINVEFDCTSTATFCSAGKTAIEANELMNQLVTVTNTGPGTSLDLQSKHVGFIFDVIVLDKDGKEIVGSGANTVGVATTGQVLGVGNDWQVHGEEIRCRYRSGNFNRMYLPDNVATYTVANNQYHKIVIEYEHNWPNSTGIAPAGSLNQAVIYASDSGTAMIDTDTNIDTVFNLTATATVFDADQRFQF
jgi:hypothetical protein